MFFYAVFAAMLRWPRPLGLWLIVALVGTCGLIGFVAPPARAPLAFWCNPIVFEFLFGILLGRLHAAGWRLPPSLAWVLGLAAMVLLYLGALRSAPSPYWPQRCIFIGLPALAICACVALSREVPLSQGRVQGMLVRAGDASYALYLSHPFTLAAMAVVWPHAGPDSPWSFVVLASSACVLVSIAFHVGIEKPITGALNARIRRSRIGTRVPVGT
jgi:peptidoglycan/LPS O-acetylase OafA/YrhL